MTARDGDRQTEIATLWLVAAVALASLAALTLSGCRTVETLTDAPEGAWSWVWSVVESFVLDIVDLVTLFA